MPLTPLPPITVRRADEVAARLPVPIDLEWVISGRAEAMGLHGRGRFSANATCRLVPTRDDWIAVNLARPTDRAGVAAAVERAVDADEPWAAVEAFAATATAVDAVGRFELLEIPAARLADRDVDPARAVVADELGDRADVGSSPVVVDLTSMWAGPLCAHLLGRCGMRVVKVESVDRPDGARAGDAGFFESLHAGHEMVSLDLRTPRGRAQLAALIEAADVVLEASRPRALAQLGIDATRVVGKRAGRTWVSITGYGRTGPRSNRVAFGDDAAVAGGLVARDSDGLPIFAADAVADPLTGLTAAVAAWEAVTDGGGRLLDISMAGVAARFATSSTTGLPLTAR